MFLLFITALVPIVQSAAIPPEKIDTYIDDGGNWYLQKYGYVADTSKTGRLLDLEDLQTGLKSLQRMGGIPETGKMDNATRKLMTTDRCGMRDFTTTDRVKRRRRYRKHGAKWSKNLLTWKLGSGNNNNINNDQVMDTLRRAFKKWSEVTNMDFRETDNSPDIWVKFARGYHDDFFAFDGPGGTLAHAFYPGETNAGDVHFDDDEKYTIKSKEGRDLLWVAVHELGHSIGLDHSGKKGAVMYPWYQPTDGKDFNLKLDDIKGAQAIYGIRKGWAPRSPTPDPARPPTPDPKKTIPPFRHCLSRFQTAFMSHDKRTYVINGQKTYIFNSQLKIEKGPIVTSKLFSGLSKIDAVFQRQWDTKNVVFSGNKYYIFQDTKMLEGPYLISEGFKGFPAHFRNINAAFVWPGNDQLYIFRGPEYWRFSRKPNTDKYRMDYGYPRKIHSAWRHVPANFDTVFAWRNGKTYFFKGSKYYRLDDRRIRVSYGYPRSIRDDWSRCPAAQLRAPDNSSNKSLPYGFMVVLISLVSLLVS